MDSIKSAKSSLSRHFAVLELLLQHVSVRRVMLVSFAGIMKVEPTFNSLMPSAFGFFVQTGR